jgi:putative aldouronate transport system permease protein
MTMLASYPLSRNDFILRKQIMFIFTFTMFFGGGLIPTYILIKKLGLIDTRAVMIIPGAVSVYNIIITRTYIKSNIPTELLDAARIDGCSDFQFFLRIVLPLSKTIMAVVALFYAVDIWNSYFNALIYLTRQQLYLLQIILREILIQNKVDAEMISKGRINVKDLAARQAIFELLKYSLIVVSSAPVFVIYPFIQKYFVKGIMIGSLKG